MIGEVGESCFEEGRVAVVGGEDVGGYGGGCGYLEETFVVVGV